MFIPSEEMSNKQIFEQTLGLLTVKFRILRCQTTKEKNTYSVQHFTDTINYRNYKGYKKISNLLTILVAFSSDFTK